MLYPLGFTPIMKEKIWGGRRLETIMGKSLPPGAKIGESWEISDYGGDLSVVAAGPLAGTTLRQLVREMGPEIVGRRADRFPLLLKLIDAGDLLSVQVHPDDEYARAHGDGENGKTEAWYVIDALPGATIYRGLVPGTTREEFARLLGEGELEKCLRSFEVRAGDCVFLPAGTVHAIGAGVLLAEIQQTSDATYRVYDWGRLGFDGKPRELHVEKALEAIDFGKGSPDKVRPRRMKGKGRRWLLVESERLAMEKLAFSGRLAEDTRGRFAMYACIAGSAEVSSAGGSAELALGASCLVPAAVGEHEFVSKADAALLKFYVP